MAPIENYSYLHFSFILLSLLVDYNTESVLSVMLYFVFAYTVFIP